MSVLSMGMTGDYMVAVQAGEAIGRWMERSSHLSGESR